MKDAEQGKNDAVVDGGNESDVSNVVIKPNCRGFIIRYLTSIRITALSHSSLLHIDFVYFCLANL